MGKGCAGRARGPGARRERAPRGAGGTRDAAPGVRRRAGRALAAAARRVPPPRPILGGVEQPKRRRRDRNRGGEGKSQLPVAKPQTQGSRGAPAGGTVSGKRKGGDAPLTCSSRGCLGGHTPPAGSDPPLPSPGARRRRDSFPSAFSPHRPGPLLSTLPSSRAPAPHLCWVCVSRLGPRAGCA